MIWDGNVTALIKSMNESSRTERVVSSPIVMQVRIVRMSTGSTYGAGIYSRGNYSWLTVWLLRSPASTVELHETGELDPWPLATRRSSIWRSRGQWAGDREHVGFRSQCQYGQARHGGCVASYP